MGKKYRKLREEDVGAIGIGAMIVFIAMVLVAGIAASVLVQTANKLEIQAMVTGEQTTGEVATGVAVIDIEGHKATDLDLVTITIQPRAGSLDIDLAQTYIEISDSSRKCVLKWDSSHGYVNRSGINGDLFTQTWYDCLTAQEFGIIELEDADNSSTFGSPVINRGDKVMLTVNATACFGGNGLAERTDVWGLVQPEEGAPGVFAFRTPASYAGDTVFDLY